MSKTSLSMAVPEILEGVLQGYLAEDEIPDSLLLLPPPPEEGSTAFKLDQEIAADYLALKDDTRQARAIQDDILYFPEATQAFNDVLPFAITEESAPHVYMILRRSLADAGLSTYAAKTKYQRPRPFAFNETSTLLPKEMEAHLKKDGAYPSGHTAVGWAWALILAELFPEQADAILKRGLDFGVSRMVLNVHWHSDVQAGYVMGAAAAARLHANPQFLLDLEAAKQEVDKQMRAK